MFNPCVLIPVYNHHLKIKQIVAQLTESDLHCYVLDDGSDENCRHTLDELAPLKNVTLVRWPENRGKGAVVCDGLIRAHTDGYSHALQIDADGQHKLADVSPMLDEAKAYPHCVISAQRAYNDMPKPRKNGRRVTDIWVWINTLSPAIKDSMCGFRVYPLSPTRALLEKYTVGKRMDFDTDILVRLYWQGLDVRHIPTRVTYEAEIPSHFDILKDNIRISRMHTFLFFGMLLRIPSLLARHISR